MSLYDELHKKTLKNIQKQTGPKEKHISPQNLKSCLTRPAVKEKDIQTAILQYLKLRKILAWKNNAGTSQVLIGTKTYWMTMGPKGSSDIIGILPNGKFLAIEVKKPGGILNSYQETFIKTINTMGGVAFMARSVNEVEEQLHGKF